MDMFPVRVLVETVRPQHCLSCSHDGQPLMDTYAIVSGQTMLSQLVTEVLSALGFPQLIQDSRGLIQINNWKPLAFETITDNQDELVANLFKEISNNISLKILTKHSSTDQHSTCITDLKQRLLKIAIEKQPSILTSVDNRDLKDVVQQIIAGGEDTLSSVLTAEHIAAVNEWLDQLSSTSSHENSRKSPISSTRFNQISEIPRLERWFRSDNNPSRPKLMGYMHILNGCAYRKANNKVTYQQICNWFSNQRASNRANTANGTSSRPNSSQSTSNKSSPTHLGHVIAARTNSNNTNLNAMSAIAAMGLTGLGCSTASNQQSSSEEDRNSFASLLNGMSMVAAAANAANASCSSGATDLSNTSDTAANGSIIPISNMPIDIRSKFNITSNGYNPLQQQQQMEEEEEGMDRRGLDGERIDGGSESPNGNDDVSVHSASDNDVDVKESGTSSPDLLLDVNSPHRHLTLNGTIRNRSDSTPAAAGGAANCPSPNSQVAQAMAAATFSSLMSPSAMFNQFNSALLASGGGSFNNAAAAAALAAACSSPVSSSNGSFGANHMMLKTPSSSHRENADNNVKMEQSTTPSSSHGQNNNNNSNTARSRLMFDPLSELPILERWFEDNPHPGWLQIETYTETLNSYQYRQNYPPISTHNVKIWFKNRRAKCKRLNIGDNPNKMTVST